VIQGKNDVKLDLFITANSPGEIAGRVVPAVREIRPRIWNCRITLVILPCQYASGEEMSLGAASGADRCIRIGKIGELLSERAGEERTKRLILHMGGDLFFSVYLSLRLSSPLWAYSSAPRWRRFVNLFLLPDADAERRFASMNVDAGKYERIGQIAIDSVVLNESEEETRESLRLAPDEPVIAFLTGSRPIEYCYGMSFFVSVASRITEKFQDHRVFFPLAATVREDLLRDSLVSLGISFKGESRVHAIDLGGGRWAEVVRDRSLEVLNCSKLAIAVPGTNNLQAAVLYVPFIMALPLDRADEYPLDGLPGLLPLWFPGFKALKRRYIMKLNERTKFVSLPNKMAGRTIVPEVRGLISPDDVADKAVELLESPEKLQEISRSFWDLTHERGASIKLAERIARWVKED
jgi:lipid-A-disaccharide synthase